MPASTGRPVVGDAYIEAGSGVVFLTYRAADPWNNFLTMSVISRFGRYTAFTRPRHARVRLARLSRFLSTALSELPRSAVSWPATLSRASAESVGSVHHIGLTSAQGRSTYANFPWTRLPLHEFK
jgi:hypothetical protein